MKLIGQAVKVGNFFLAYNYSSDGNWILIPHEVDIHVFTRPFDAEQALKKVQTERKDEKCEIVEIYCK